MKENFQYLQASVLDRLIDDDPKAFRESVQNSYLSLSQIRSSVLRDIENLLNSRRCVLEPPGVFKEVNKSLFVYGMQDFTSLNPKSMYVKQQLRLDVERVISLFESRLRNVSVHIEESTQDNRHMRFRITAMLVVEPLNEPVTFDTFFDINSSICVISK